MPSPSTGVAHMNDDDARVWMRRVVAEIRSPSTSDSAMAEQTSRAGLTMNTLCLRRAASSALLAVGRPDRSPHTRSTHKDTPGAALDSSQGPHNLVRFDFLVVFVSTKN